MWKIKPYKKCQNLLEGFICPIDTGRLMGDPEFFLTLSFFLQSAHGLVFLS